MNEKHLRFIDVARERYGDIVTKKEIKEICSSEGLPFPSWLRYGERFKLAHGKYQLPSIPDINGNMMMPAPVAVAQNVPESVVNLEPSNLVKDLNMDTIGFTENLVPKMDDLFVPFGNFKMIKKVLSTEMFYPIFVTGLSGNGKTF